MECPLPLPDGNTSMSGDHITPESAQEHQNLPLLRPPMGKNLSYTAILPTESWKSKMLKDAAISLTI